MSLKNLIIKYRKIVISLWLLPTAQVQRKSLRQVIHLCVSMGRWWRNGTSSEEDKRRLLLWKYPVPVSISGQN